MSRDFFTRSGSLWGFGLLITLARTLAGNWFALFSWLAIAIRFTGYHWLAVDDWVAPSLRLASSSRLSLPTRHADLLGLLRYLAHCNLWVAVFSGSLSVVGLLPVFGSLASLGYNSLSARYLEIGFLLQSGSLMSCGLLDARGSLLLMDVWLNSARSLARL